MSPTPPASAASPSPLGTEAAILVTGATGRVAFPIARALARNYRVLGMARCSSEGDEERLRRAGIEPVVGDVASYDLSQLPSSLTHVFHAAASLGTEARRDWRRTMDVNAVATGRLMAACRGLAAFVLCSSGSVYEYQGQRALREDDPPGVHLGVYSLSKIAAEAVATFASVDHGVPTTIIRIFSTYGPEGGAPVDRLRRILARKEIPLHPDRPNHFTPIFEDDYVRLAMAALNVGSIPPTVVNWAGSEVVSAEEYCRYLGGLVGIEPRFHVDPTAPWPLWADVTRMHELLGRTEIPWRVGMGRMAQSVLERPLR